jgi:uncharacterized protein YndB with AHSA1/START domain
MRKKITSDDARLDFDLLIAIRAPPRLVFAVLADIQNFEALPIDAQVKMTKHPASLTRVGTRWDEKVRVFGGWWLSTESVVTDIEEPATIGMDFSSRWLDGHLTYTLDASEGGTALHQRESLRLRWPLRWFRSQVERKLRSQLQSRLVDIRNLLEHQRDLSGLPA